ncbi:hypothetical protein BCR34DRAFT_588351 [Clohesyomyces aquaticus]|uniref:Uncharacterized protein n=1 Tax=Clohesyomyces aquaticus TaxID=1231657 RepID=A0A1Y1ZLT9_9PLEO|nr:hypothetical protein BCR34DRAFT_588351 [Clohesyomyces aquaticus]
MAVTHYFSGAANKANGLDHARALLENFEDFRRETIGRPVVFVAHSLSRLLLKTILRKISGIKPNMPDARAIRNICASIARTIFLGTPHRRSNYADLGQKVALAARAVQFNKRTSILRDLKVDSSILEVLHESFLEIINSQKFGLFTIPGFFTQYYTKRDLEVVIHTTLQDNPRLRSTLDSNNAETRNIVHKLQKELARKWNGVFLWHKLVLEDILTECTNGRSLHNLMGRLVEPPKELGRYYDHTMQLRGNERYSRERGIMLDVMRCVGGRLSAHDFFAATQLFRVENLQDHTLDLPGLDDAERQLRSRCGPLVEIVEGDLPESDVSDPEDSIIEVSESRNPSKNHSQWLDGYFVQFLHQTVKVWAAKRSSASTVPSSDNGYTALLKVVVHESLDNAPLRMLTLVCQRIRDVEAFNSDGSFRVPRTL